MGSYLPIEWNFGDNPCDGRGGEVVVDAGTIYVVDYDYYSDTFEDLIHKTSISELVARVVEGHVSPSGKIEDSEAIEIMKSIKGALQDAIDKIDNAITV